MNHRKNYADQLGALRAQIKELQDEAKAIENVLKDKGIREMDGKQYRVAVSYGVSRTSTNWKKIAERFDPSRQVIVGNTNTSYHDRVTVSALPKH